MGQMDELRRAREDVVLAHAAAEQRRDFDAAMATFGTPTPRYELPGGEVIEGHDAVMDLYHDLFGAFPDFEPTVDRSALAHFGDSVMFTAQLTATHTGSFRGLPATGRRVDLPIAAIFDFDGTDLLGERVLFDRLTMFIQLGVARDPDSTSGKLLTLVNHPLHLLRAALGSRHSHGRGNAALNAAGGSRISLWGVRRGTFLSP